LAAPFSHLIGLKSRSYYNTWWHTSGSQCARIISFVLQKRQHSLLEFLVLAEQKTVENLKNTVTASSQSYKTYNYFFVITEKNCKTEKKIVFTIFSSIPIKHDIFVITEKIL